MNNINSFLKKNQLFVSIRSNKHEQESMLMEDLNAQLLERAELVAQQEEYEFLLDERMRLNGTEYDFAVQGEDLDRRTEEIQVCLVGLQAQLQRIQYQCFDQQEINYQHQRINGRIASENKLSRQLQVQRQSLQSKVRVHVQQTAKEVFGEYLVNQQGTLKKLRLCYGDVVYAQVLQEHRDRLEELISSQCNCRVREVSRLQNQYVSLQHQINRNISYVDGSLTQEIQSIRAQRKQPVDRLKKKVETLELQKSQLEKQVMEMSMKITSQHQRYGQRPTEVIYGEILRTPLQEINRSPVERSSYDTNNYKTTQKSYNWNDIRNDYRNCNNTNDSLILSQIQDVSLTSLDRICQLSADDSLLLHLQDISSSKENTKRYMNMPLQKNQKSISQQLQDDEDMIRLQTITEEQLSTTRQDEERRFKKRRYSTTQSNTTVVTGIIGRISVPISLENTTIKSTSKSKDGFLQQIMKQTRSLSMDQRVSRHYTSHPTQNIRNTIEPSFFSSNEEMLLTRIKPLLRQVEVYKKFSTQTQLKKDEYNPFTNKNQNPQALGYGHRLMNLSQSLTHLEFKSPLKPQIIESSISIDQIIRPNISPLTQQFLQKKISHENQLFQLSIVVQHQGRVEILLQGQANLLSWFKGIQIIVEKKKDIQRLGKKIQINQ